MFHAIPYTSSLILFAVSFIFLDGELDSICLQENIIIFQSTLRMVYNIPNDSKFLMKSAYLKLGIQWHQLYEEKCCKWI